VKGVRLLLHSSKELIALRLGKVGDLLFQCLLRRSLGLGACLELLAQLPGRLLLFVDVVDVELLVITDLFVPTLPLGTAGLPGQTVDLDL